MSTRCQVKVQDARDAVTLYHHTDGYPEYMIPKMVEAWQFGESDASDRDFKKGSAGRVASFLCAVDPGVFEPEEGHELHGDIEYYYVLHVTSRGPLAWTVDIYQPSRKTFMEIRSIRDLKKKVSGAPLMDLYAEIAEQERKKR